jgi:hypothetical protein
MTKCAAQPVQGTIMSLRMIKIVTLTQQWWLIIVHSVQQWD